MVEAAPPGPGPLRRTFLVPEIKSLDQYDFSRAKAAASLAWVLRAAFGGAEHVPSELWEPFYTDQYAQEHVKPPVTRLLLSAELYCRAWRQALPQLETPPSPSALLALLARRGTVPALPERPVQEADLRHQPILMGAHLAVIDALMVAFAFEWTKTLPGPLALASLEHKLLFWVDTTIRRLQEKTEQEAAQRASPSASADGVAPTQPSIRYRKDRALARRAPCFPTVTSLQDLASGAALAATIHCYCPQLLRLEEVCLKDPMSVADSLYNLQLVQDFCASRLPRGCPLSLEDLLYVPPPLKVNLVVLLAEMFMCFEVLKPDFVQAKDLPDGHAASPRATDASTPQNSSGSSSPVFNFRHPLLSPGGPQSPLRGSTGSLKSSPSMSHMEVLGKAWNRQLSRPLSQAVSFSTPFGLDSDVDVVMGDPVLLRSVSSDSLGPPRPVPARTPTQPPAEPGDLPTIEEALQIIHSAEPRLLPDGAADGSFYLHSPEGPSKPTLASSYPPDKVPAYLPHPEGPSKPSPCQAGEVLKPQALSEGSPKAMASSPAASNSEVKMTSFAERKKQLVKAEVEAGAGSPVATPAAPEALSSEMTELGARLEEKRRAIEAQKRRIEAIFAKHRQRLGKSAFLQVQPREAGGEAEAEAEAEPGPAPGGERPAGEGQGEPSPRPKAVTFSPELGPVPPEGLGDYNRAVNKLSAALNSLQRDMQRLTDQQQRLLGPPEAPGPAPPPAAPSPAAWVIPGPTMGPKAASPSPVRRASAARRSPGPGPSPTPRSPKHTRPADLRLAPLTRVLTPPHDVDSLPHLRKFSPSQVPVQTRSSILLSEGPPPEEPSARPGLIEIPLGSLEEPSAEDEGDGSPPGAEDSLEEEASSEGEPRGGLGFFYKDEDKPEDEMAQKRASLLERQQRRVEEARRRKQWQEAEKEQRREEAVRLAQEEVVPSPPAPTATSVPAARAPAEEEVGTRRGEFTRLEYERRAQLKLMDDLDKVLRPRGAGGPGRGGRRAPRPRSGCCDDSALARSPARGLLGSRLSKVYSQSTLSLSTVANEANNLGVKRPSRAPSPSGLMSPSRLPGNRDRDWENGSNASSPASVPEYTGPRLYKEPSAKSNKFIIHNALSHCCLAGRVNEPQKNRILEEIEKSKANHFLILFRDSSCQFRALYTLSGETEELSRLAGYGPRTVTPAMVEGIYKYNSDRKRFTQIPAKTMSMSVDAFTIQGHLWQSKKPTTPKKGGSTPK
ncbi:calmodulin regulated spectrin associated protein family member 3 [Rhinolophus ferrumequinum]|uniref:Calmodulin regulated spectrin associated protein family member 3 n=1 Tax=Rhinolophus ferrumequinum TaxID=59479 RepID=A0A7J7TZ49_RHIFE|nr:calmodulin-regulated spectrin-associated protein 3 isoform X10 [Rhinolophus ferrumequinum]KAF6305882.1 calmodulin regulated spectrin associated protein family member 3 [Rhinolophus ferrumequinum]